MLNLVGIVVIALGILGSIALHEVGHLVPAKRSGVKVTQYMIGFGPTLWSRRRGETEYGIKAIPLGGYIRMIGMFPPRADGTVRNSSTGAFSALVDEARHASASEVQPGDEDRVFYKLPVRKKIVIMLGGPTMNLVLAVIFFTILLGAIGLPSATISNVSRCVIPASEPDRSECRPGDVAAPALAAGLQPGERITALDGHAVRSWSDVPALVRNDADGRVLVSLERDGVRRDVPVQLVTTELPRLNGAPGETVRANFLGVSPVDGLRRLPPGEIASQIWFYVKQTTGTIVGVPQRMVGVWHAAFGTGVRDREGPIGVIGVSRLGGEVVAAKEFTAQDRLALLLVLLGGLNLALFVFNLVPLLPLDGGHVAGAIWEGVRRQVARLRHRADPGYVDVARMLPLAYTVAILLISMSALLLYADIVNPIRLRG
jgi:membrane-associated protease RseP (regulator of RpoE activity)